VIQIFIRTTNTYTANWPIFNYIDYRSVDIQAFQSSIPMVDLEFYCRMELSSNQGCGSGSTLKKEAGSGSKLESI